MHWYELHDSEWNIELEQVQNQHSSVFQSAAQGGKSILSCFTVLSFFFFASLSARDFFNSWCMTYPFQPQPQNNDFFF